ncbi:MAG TPA: septum site-determining protein Ssd [Asanoa sp.]
MPAAATSVRSGARLPLVVTGDPELLDDLLRLAAAAGTEVDVAMDPPAARARWSLAPLVVVGTDQAPAFEHVRLPPRRRIVVVGRADGPAPGWELAEQIGAEHVALLPAAEPWLVDRFGGDLTGDGRSGGRVIAVLGGRGGAGASVLAAGLAVTAARQKRRTLLVDADPLGGGLDLILGWEELDGMRWSALAESQGRLDAGALARVLPSRDSLVMLSFDRGDAVPLPLPAEAMAAALDAGRRAHDLVVVDLPRRLDAAAVAALQAADRTFLVVPAELRATAAAIQVAKVARLHCTDLAVVVRGPAPSKLRAAEVARSVGLTLAGELKPEDDLCKRLERGEAPAGARGPLHALCSRLIGDVIDTPAEAPA